MTHDAEQHAAAMLTKLAVEMELGYSVTAEVVTLQQFYPAEDYHQKYYLQGESDLAMEIRAYYPDFNDFIDSTAAARLNGFVAGYRDRDLLDEELESYGLSPEMLDLLKANLN